MGNKKANKYRVAVIFDSWSSDTITEFENEQAGAALDGNTSLTSIGPTSR